jgi:hypothetical protein
MFNYRYFGFKSLRIWATQVVITFEKRIILTDNSGWIGLVLYMKSNLLIISFSGLGLTRSHVVL